MTITIPKELANKGDLVVLPRREYEELVRISREATKAKGNTKKLPVWLRESLQDIKEGKVSGPFNSVDTLITHLEK